MSRSQFSRLSLYAAAIGALAATAFVVAPSLAAEDGDRSGMGVDLLAAYFNAASTRAACCAACILAEPVAGLAASSRPT